MNPSCFSIAVSLYQNAIIIGMKSRVYKIRNFQTPAGVKPKAIHLKPVPALIMLLCVGIFMTSFESYVAVIGMILVLMAVFAMFILPDRYLLLFFPEYMVLNNQNDESLAMVVYYDEIVNWRYDYHSSYDVLSISLVDGSSENIEMFSKMAVKKYLNMYVPGKEVKNIRVKEKSI